MHFELGHDWYTIRRMTFNKEIHDHKNEKKVEIGIDNQTFTYDLVYLFLLDFHSVQFFQLEKSSWKRRWWRRLVHCQEIKAKIQSSVIQQLWKIKAEQQINQQGQESVQDAQLCHESAILDFSWRVPWSWGHHKRHMLSSPSWKKLYICFHNQKQTR